jgi:hypothetical protein
MGPSVNFLEIYMRGYWLLGVYAVQAEFSKIHIEIVISFSVGSRPVVSLKNET